MKISSIYHRKTSWSLGISVHFIAFFIFNSFLYLWLNKSCDFFDFGLWREEFNHFSCRINKKFGKIPRDLFCFLCFGIIKFTVISQKYEKRMSFLSIYLNFFHYWEFNIKVLSHKLFNFLGSSTFLPKELITRKC